MQRIINGINKSDVEILAVEDSLTQAEQLRYILEQEGYRASVSRNGREALARMDLSMPTLVISDIVMPEMDGYELCHRIKSDEVYKDIPVILLTSLSDPGAVFKGLEAGADHFISKPYNEEYLLGRIWYILTNRALRSQSNMDLGIDVFFGGRRHRITAERVQVIDFLMSAIESAIHKNMELEHTNRALREARDLLAEQARELRELSLRDELTGLINRRGFMNLAQHQLKVAMRAGTPLLLFYIDLDDLKTINDSFGHKEGDRALAEVADVMKRSFRDSDIVARLGGDEFVALAICASEGAVERLKGNLRVAVAERNARAAEASYRISLSVGVAVYDPDRPVCLEDLLHEADDLMYAEKQAKKKAVIPVL